MLNYRNKILVKLISLILTQVFLLTGAAYPESSSDRALRVPIDPSYNEINEIYKHLTPDDNLKSIISRLKDTRVKVDERELENLRASLNQQDSVAFAGWLVDELKDRVDNYKLYLALMSYAGFIRYHGNHYNGHQIAIKATRLRPDEEEQALGVEKYAKGFMRILKETNGSAVHRLKQAASVMESEPELAEELQKEFAWRYDLIRHLIGYINQVPENDSEIGGDISMLGSPARFAEYLDEIYSRSGIEDEGIKSLIAEIKGRIAAESKFLQAEKTPEKRPRIIRQINLDAEAKAEKDKFKWLAANMDRYETYDAIMLVGSLQAMGPELSPYEYAGLHFDGRYGNDKDFIELVDAARKKGIELIVDVVLEHTGKDLSGKPFPAGCYSDKPNEWGLKLDYSKDETVILATWFLRRLRNLGVRWIRCDQMGKLGDKGYEVWENAHKLGLGIIGEWEYFPDVPQANYVYSKQEYSEGIHYELVNYKGISSFSKLRAMLQSRVSSLPNNQSSWVIFDDHDEQQFSPIINAIGRDKLGDWNLDKLKAYYLAVFVALLSLPEGDRERISIMEHSGTAEGYPYPLSYMYGVQSYTDILSEGEKIFPGFAGFSQKIRQIAKEILDYKGKFEVRYQRIGDDYEGIVEVDLKDEAGNNVKMYTFSIDLKEGQYRADIQVVEEDKLAMAMMNPAALLFLRSGQVVTEPKWSKLQTALDMVLTAEGAVTVDGIREKLESKMKALGILKQDTALSAENVRQLLDELSSAELVQRRDGSYGIFGNEQKQRAALWCNDYDYIREEIVSKLDYPSQLNAVLLSYESHAKELWPYYPVEAFYPVWDAVSTMDKTAQSKLVTGISNIEKACVSESRAKDFYSHPIFNSIRLTLLPSSEIPEDFVERYAENLAGKTMIIAAPEISRMAGGLSRVTVFKSIAIKNLMKNKARLLWAEPYYNDFNEDPGEKIMDDLEVEFRGRVIQCEVYRRIKEIAVPNEKGEIETFEMEDYLLRDKEGYYVGKLYKYDQEDSRVTQDEFSDFFSAAVITLTNRMAEMAEKSDGKEGWADPFLSLHDGQVLSAAFYRRLLYEKDPVKYASLIKIPISGFTHTYNNRLFKYFDSIEKAREFLRDKRRIEDKYHYIYLRKLPDGKILVDDSSAGLRTVHMPSGVSRVQAFEVSDIDALPLRGFANGDLRELSAKEFRKILLELYPDADVEHPAVEQMIAVDKKAKESLIAMLKEKRNNPLIISGYLEIDPEKIIISYSGRCDPVKLGIGEGKPERGGTEDLKAFTKENIRRAVIKGAQMIIFGNVQPNEDSGHLYKELKEFAEEIKEDKNRNGNNSVYKGTFILVDKFTPDDQRVLLAATQLQVQVSRRRTEAEGFKEADVAVSGGKQLAAPWIEGGTQISLGKVGVNLIVPYDNTEEAFWKAIEKDIGLYDNDRKAYALGEVDSIPLSRKLNVLNEMAAYLIWWSDEIGGKDTFDIELMPRNDAMTVANVNLSVKGIQISEAKPSLGDTMPVDLSDNKEEISINLRIAPGIEPPRVYAKTNALSSPDTLDDKAWTTIPLELAHFDKGEAVYRVTLKGIKRGDCALTWKVGDTWLGNPNTNAILHINDRNNVSVEKLHRATDL